MTAQRPYFYFDPPYWGCEGDYGAGVFAAEDFGRLAELLGQLQGRFLLSINDRAEIRRIFSASTLEEVSTTYTIGEDGGRPGNARELLISSSRM